MANTNTTTQIVDTIFARGLKALREMAIMPRYVNRGYDPSPGVQGSTVEISIPAALATNAVTPSYVAPDDAGISPTKKVITLDDWHEAPFFLTDKEMVEIRDGFPNDQMTEAVRAIANKVDDSLLGLYTQVYNFAGVAGTTPFATDLAEAREARKLLNKSLAPNNDRFIILDEEAESNALGLRAIQDASAKGDTSGLREGAIGRVLGADWDMDQNVPTHTAGTDLVGAINDAGAIAAGVKTLTVDGFTSAPNEGDVFTIAGVTGTYVVTSGTTTTTLNFEPGLENGLATGDNNEVITVKASHTVNLMFQRGAFALAARPPEASDPMNLNPNRRAIMDPVSGLSFALEITRQHYRTRFAFSTLYGVQAIRPQLACRIAG